MVVRDGLRVVVPGVLIGIPEALAAAQLVRSQLYGIVPDDPKAIAGASAVFLRSGLVAAFVPLLRASRAKPAERCATSSCKISPARRVPLSRRCARRHRPRLRTRVAVLLSE